MTDTVTQMIEEPRSAGPFSRGKLAMWLFLGTEVMFFTGLIGTYIVLRLGMGSNWPDPKKTLAIGLTAFNTFLLICSSVTMVQALTAIQRGNQLLLRVFLGATTVIGACFLSVQVYEYHHLATEGHVYAPENNRLDRRSPLYRKIVAFHRDHPDVELNVFSGGQVIQMVQKTRGPGRSEEELTERYRQWADRYPLIQEADLVKFSFRTRDGLVAIARRGIITPVPAGDLVQVYRLGDIADAYPGTALDPARANYEDPGKEATEARNYPNPGIFVKYYDHGQLKHYGKTVRIFHKPITVRIGDADQTFPQGGYEIKYYKYPFDEDEKGELKDIGFLPASGIFGSTFYTMTGFHGAHVFGGVVLMLCITIAACLGKFTQTHHNPVELSGLYWHFVDLVWILLFTIVYLF